MIVALDNSIIKAMAVYSRYSKPFEVNFEPLIPGMSGTGGEWPVDIYIDGRLVALTEPVPISRVGVSILVWSQELLKDTVIPLTPEEKEIERRHDTFRTVEFEYVGYDWDKKKTTKIRLGSPYTWNPGETGLAQLPNEDKYRFIDITDVFYGPGLNIVWAKLKAWKRDPWTNGLGKYFPAKAEGKVDLIIEHGY